MIEGSRVVCVFSCAGRQEERFLCSVNQLNVSVRCGDKSACWMREKQSRSGFLRSKETCCKKHIMVVLEGTFCIVQPPHLFLWPVQTFAREDFGALSCKHCCREVVGSLDVQG